MNKLVLSKNARVYRLVLGSLEEFAERAMFGKTDIPEEQRNSRHTDEPDWYGSSTVEEAYNWAINGWPNSSTLLAKHRELIPETLLNALLPAEEFATKWNHAVAGSMIDMSVAARDAGPEQFLTEVEDNLEVRRGKNVQRIVLNGVNSFNVNSDVIVARGIMAYAAVEHLETIGYSIELSVEITAKCRNISNTYVTTVVKLKNFGEMVNADKLMFALSSPAFLRRLWFGVVETLPAKVRNMIGMTTYGGTVGIATRQKPNTLCLDLYDNPTVEQLKEEFIEELKTHYLNNEVNFDENEKESETNK